MLPNINRLSAMAAPMSKSMFANPKAALGFAGVTIAIAIAASFSVGLFLPADEAEPEVVGNPEAVTEQRTQQPVAPATTWADAGSEDSFDDDWSDAATNTASNRTWNGSSSANELVEPDFGDYSPESQPGSRQARAGSSRSSNGSGARISSRAAPDAPPLSPPSGGSETPQISIEN